MTGPVQPRLRPYALAIFAAGIGLAVTILVTFVPGLRFAYKTTAGHLALENVDASVAAIVAVLFYGRHHRSRCARDLFISVAFGLLALIGGMLVLLPAFTHRPDVVWTSWIPLVVRLFAAGLIALAAANPDRRTDDVPGAWRLGGIAAAAVLLAVILTGSLAGNRFPSPLNPDVSPAASHRPVLVGATALLAAQAAHALLYAVAAVLFVLEAERTRDDLTRWLGVGCVFGAFARVNYLLFPSLYSQWLYIGDFLRSAFYLVLGYGALRELRSYWQLHSEAVVFAERRRIARDLHDGTVQELGYIRSVVRGAKLPLDAAIADRIAAAAERALAEARQAIAVLSLPLDEPMADVLRRTADEVADRYDVDVQVDAVDGSVIAREKRDAIVRVVREAVSNAARHAQPSRIDVRVGPGSVEVQDDGRGFDPTAVSNGGYGLVSMRDRAEAVGAEFEIVSAAGAGTTVRMVWDVSLD